MTMMLRGRSILFVAGPALAWLLVLAILPALSQEVVAVHDNPQETLAGQQEQVFSNLLEYTEDHIGVDSSVSLSLSENSVRTGDPSHRDEIEPTAIDTQHSGSTDSIQRHRVDSTRGAIIEEKSSSSLSEPLSYPRERQIASAASANHVSSPEGDSFQPPFVVVDPLQQYHSRPGYDSESQSTTEVDTAGDSSGEEQNQSQGRDSSFQPPLIVVDPLHQQQHPSRPGYGSSTTTTTADDTTTTTTTTTTVSAATEDSSTQTPPHCPFLCEITIQEAMFNNQWNGIVERGWDVEQGETMSVDSLIFNFDEEDTRFKESCDDATGHCQRGATEGTLLTNVVRSENYGCVLNMQDEDGEPNLFREVYDIDLPDTFVQENKEELDSGFAQLCIRGGYINTTSHSVQWSSSSNSNDAIDALDLLTQEIDDEERRHRHLRRLALTSGQKRMLGVIIQGSNGAEIPFDPEDDLRASLFGLRQSNSQRLPQASVMQQFAAMSHGVLTYQPAVGNGINQGIITITIPEVFANVAISPLIGAMLQGTQRALGVSNLAQVTDHVVLAVPSGSTLRGSTGWISFTNMRQPYSVHQNGYARTLSTVIHEVGHSIGFYHSGLGANQYGDLTGYMGPSYNAFGTPLKAFNAHKHWLSGWFKNSVLVEVDPVATGAVSGRLGAFIYYDVTDPLRQYYDAIVVKVGTLYMQYNVGKRYNTNGGNLNKVTVVQAASAYSVSDLVAALGPTQGSFYRFPNYSPSGSDLIITFCGAGGDTSTAEYAMISLHIDDGIQSSSCGTNNGFLSSSSTANKVTPKPVRPPTKRPTKKPTMRPTKKPTMMPTKKPTMMPTKKPTTMPTTKKPTLQPTRKPSFQPTKNPFLQPTISPQPTQTSSSEPTKSPFLEPTNMPSPRPTSKPTFQPTKNPLVQPTNMPFPKPVGKPSSQPKRRASSEPTKKPVVQPTKMPSPRPTKRPSSQPTKQPVKQPTKAPSPRPTRNPIDPPTNPPTGKPTLRPTPAPTRKPSALPTLSPSDTPSDFPTEQPSPQPSKSPTERPARPLTGQSMQSPVQIPTATPQPVYARQRLPPFWSFLGF